MRFLYANEAHALMHSYQTWSGLEDIAQLLMQWLALVGGLYITSSWWFGRAKKRHFNFMLACLLFAMVIVQFVSIFHAAVRLPRLSRRQLNLSPCLASTKGGKIEMYPPEGPYNDPPRRNPVCARALSMYVQLP